MADGEVQYTDEGRVKLYVGSLPFDTRAPDLEDMFSKYGSVSNAFVVMEKEDPSRSRGFGFVEFDTLKEAKDAIDGLNESPLGGRFLRIQHAGKPASGRPPQRRGGGRGGRGGYGDRGGRGGGGRGGGRGRGRGGFGGRGGRGGGGQSYGGYNNYNHSGGYNNSHGGGSNYGSYDSSGYGSGQGQSGSSYGGGYGGQGGNTSQGRSDWY